MSQKIYEKVVSDFGREWSKFDQSVVPKEELYREFSKYFRIFNWEPLPKNARGFDLGCGSGRWAQFVAPRVAELYCIDPSEEALQVARRTLAEFPNCSFCRASVENMPLENNSMDFGYSLGVLHHVNDTAEGIRSCVSKLKPGAPLLLYLYYAFDNRPLWYRRLWKASDILRRLVSHSPYSLKYMISQFLAFTVYLPLATIARLSERCGIKVERFPLSGYRNMCFNRMRNDSLDRFGTLVEKRFTKKQIESMMSEAGLTNITFSNDRPFWCVIGYKDRLSLKHYDKK